MDFTLSKQQQMVQKMYREFAENEVKPLAKKVDAEEYFPKETVEKMGKLGMMGIYFPKEYGGAGGDVLSYAMFPKVAPKFFEYRSAHQTKIDSTMLNKDNKTMPV